MGVARAGTGFHGTVGQSSAQVIDGSLKFNPSSNSHFTRTPSSAGNRRTFTLSYWIKESGKGSSPSNNPHILWSGTAVETRGGMVHRGSSGSDEGRIYMFNQVSNTTNSAVWTDSKHRDFLAWKHVVFEVDSTQGTSTNRVKIYINGVEQAVEYKSTPTQNLEFQINIAQEHRIGRGIPDDYGNFFLAQYYFIDGQALGPEEFGFTDPLTNTWRPKKYEGTFGTNGFWLPFDGNSPIGKDQSGNGNDWTPVNFVGSNSIDKATGGFPILNTTSGGKVATVGTRDDENASSIVMAIPFTNDANDISSRVRGSGSNLSVATSGSPAADSDPAHWYGSSFNVSTNNYIDTIGVVSTFAFLHQPEAAGTVEGWINTNAINVQGPWFQTSNGTDEVGIMIRQNSSTNVFCQINRGVSGQAINISGNVTVAHNRWYHWAFVKSADGFAQFFLNGEPVADKVPISTDAGASNAASTNTSSSFAGRIAKNNGEARGVGANVCDYRAYTIQKYAFDTPFVPASPDPDIIPDTPSGVSLSSNLAEITNGSVNFDGTGDYLQVPNHADLRFGSGAFCVEAFVYYSETSGNGTIAGLWNSGSNRRSWLFQIESDNRRLRGFFSNNGSTVTQVNGSTGQMSRNAWHHVAFTRSGNDFRIFLDGVEVGSATSSNSLYDNSDDDIGVGSAQGGASSDPITGFISNVRIVKGSAVYTSDFTPPTAPLTNITNTKLLCSQSTVSATAAAVIPTGSITANGNAVVTTFSPFNTDISTVRGQESSYATLNPRNRLDNAVLSNNNLSWTCDNSNGGTVLANVTVDSGKYYWEVTVDNGNRFHAGVHAGAGCSLCKNDAGLHPTNWAFRTDGAKVHNNSESSTNFSNVTAIGNVVQLAYDADGGNLWFGANGHWFEGNPSALSGPSYTGVTSTAGMSPFLNRRTNDNGASINFGQKPFKYAPPKGFQTLNISNIRSEVKARPDQYVGVTTYTGNGSTQTIDIGHEPDFLWIKNRDDSSQGAHRLFDTVRGSNKTLYSSFDLAEAEVANSLNSFNSNGFTVGSGNWVNGTGDGMVAWSWKAGGSKGTFNKDDVGYASAAAAGLTCTADLVGASVGTKQGFSIIQYQATSGETVAHGLSEQPSFMIIKNMDSANDWMVYHKSETTLSSQGLNLNNGDATFTSGSNTFITGKSATTFTVGSSAIVQNGSDDMIAYIWHDVPGLQKFGMYTGNGASDGPFISCGFKPVLIWVKNTSSGSTDWVILDTATSNSQRDGNPMFRRFAANNNDPQGSDSSTNARFDFYSNGFKSVGGDGTFVNTNGDNYLYCAWAEAPTSNLYGAQANAR